LDGGHPDFCWTEETFDREHGPGSKSPEV